ncbi:hypothetical protein CesoFtcFv8_013179 [Champsocephalus esox]|uniref:Uncharacterized protein n=1 Tax=Champsocephalus esox TaxID=159716 RepID=A0AAN8BX03_9TELE|nr:hypothetical protein CesoFtcFv8_013179 [Champsocephalus esox]
MKESDWSEDKEQKGKGGQRGVCGSYNRGRFGRWRSAVKSLEKRARAHFLLLLTPTPTPPSPSAVHKQPEATDPRQQPRHSQGGLGGPGQSATAKTSLYVQAEEKET